MSKAEEYKAYREMLKEDAKKKAEKKKKDSSKKDSSKKATSKKPDSTPKKSSAPKTSKRPNTKGRTARAGEASTPRVTSNKLSDTKGGRGDGLVEMARRAIDRTPAGSVSGRTPTGPKVERANAGASKTSESTEREFRSPMVQRVMDWGRSSRPFGPKGPYSPSASEISEYFRGETSGSSSRKKGRKKD